MKPNMRTCRYGAFSRGPSQLWSWRAFGRGEGSRTPACGAVRLASDSYPAAGRSLQPEEAP